MDHTKLLCDISELNHLFRDSVSVENFLQQITEMVSKHMQTEVCSIYLYDDDEEILTLKATKGLNHEMIGKITLALGEGLTGISLKELRPINISNATQHPDNKLFWGTGEQNYENFLAVPIARGVERIGVLVLQRTQSYTFSDSDVLACKAVASQLANIIENARFIISMHSEHEEKSRSLINEQSRLIHGKVASEGYCLGETLVLDKEKTFNSLLQRRFTRHYTIKDFKNAVKQTANQLEEMQEEVEEKLSDAASLIFASHLLILKDHEFIGQMESMIAMGTNPPQAILQIAKKYMDIFEKAQNVFVREKVQDVEDLTVRLISNITSDQEIVSGYRGKIVIARDIFPSELLKMTSEKIGGIILVSGGVTSHLSILASSLAIPMVIANDLTLLDVANKTKVLLDADTGNIYLKPNQDVIDEFQRRNKQREKISQLDHNVKSETKTKDLQKITLLANINLLSDISLAKKVKCEGVGLYRTEFPFIVRNSFPSEQEQYITYRKLVTSMKGQPVIFRTLDVGGDKMLSYYHNTIEQNPAIGMRSIRFSLENKEVFIQQIRAILRAGEGEKLKIMFPMISSIDEFDAAKNIVLECIESLRNESEEFNSEPAIGMMIELPSVIELIDDFAKEADFFSIGTNDFIQFMLGVDRTNEKVASFYMPYHPSVLRAMKTIVESVQAHGKEISICGSMSSDEKYIKFLLGIGLRVLSVNPSHIPRIQKVINSITISDAQTYATKLISQNRACNIAKLMDIQDNT